MLGRALHVSVCGPLSIRLLLFEEQPSLITKNAPLSYLGACRVINEKELVRNPYIYSPSFSSCLHLNTLYH